MESMQPVCPVDPVAPYIGGKSKLAAKVIARLEAFDHEFYAEPFMGMGGVFLRRPWRPKSEVINDVNGELVTLYRILQRHYVAFLEMMKFQLTTREAFDRLSRTDPATLTDLERAARFLYLQRTAFGGKVTGQTFGVAAARPARFDITKLAATLEEVHSRLASVTIENLPFYEFIARYDTSQTLFYLDPPYWDCESDYGKNVFVKEDFERLATQLSQIQGGFLLSLNDTPSVRQTFADFEMEEVEVLYTLAQSEAVAFRELFITGGNLPRRERPGESRMLF